MALLNSLCPGLLDTNIQFCQTHRMDNVPAPSHIRKARERAKLTQQALGALVGTKRGSVSGWEKGRFRPDPTRAVLLVRFLPGLTLDQIYAPKKKERPL